MRILLPAMIAGLSVFLALVFVWRRWGFGKKRTMVRYPDPEDIILPPLVVSPIAGPPAPPPAMEPPKPPPLPPDAVCTVNLDPGDTVHVATGNSHYRFKLVDKALGWYEVYGGRIKRLRPSVIAHFISSIRHGHAYHQAFVPGMSLQFFVQHDGNPETRRVVTTPLTRVLLTKAKTGT